MHHLTDVSFTNWAKYGHARFHCICLSRLPQSLLSSLFPFFHGQFFVPAGLTGNYSVLYILRMEMGLGPYTCFKYHHRTCEHKHEM